MKIENGRSKKTKGGRMRVKERKERWGAGEEEEGEGEKRRIGEGK